LAAPTDPPPYGRRAAGRSLDAVDRAVRQLAREGVDGPREIALVPGLEGQEHAVARLVDLRIGAEHQVGELPQQGIEDVGDLGLVLADVELLQVERDAGEAVADRVELLLEELRDAGKMWTFSTTTTGNQSPPTSRTSEPSGIIAILRMASLTGLSE
jgi:hypothetical protein